MSLSENDSVLTTDEAIEYLRDLQTHLVEIYPSWENKGDQSRKGLEDSPIRIIQIREWKDRVRGRLIKGKSKNQPGTQIKSLPVTVFMRV